MNTLLRWPGLRLQPAVPAGPVAPAVFLILFCGSLFGQGIASRGLWASHEARAAQNAQRMLDDGTWLLPRLYDGQVELQKPPGFYWLVAGTGWARGAVDAVAVRLPAMLAGMITVLLVWRHLYQRGRPAAALVAGIVLAGAVHFTGTARIGRIDVPLACVVAAIMLVSRDALAEPFAGGWRPRSAVASRLHLGLLAGAALLLKGPIGVVLPAAALSGYVLVERWPLRRCLWPVLVSGPIALAVAGPWFLWANAATDGDFFRTFFLYHHVNRAFGGAEALAGHPAWYYLPRFAADFLPWSPLLAVALVQRRWRGDADARFGLAWLAVMVAVLSVSRFKRADYLLPAYAGAAIFLGCALERWYLDRPPRTRRRLAAAFLALAVLLPAGWLGFDQVVTTRLEASRGQAGFARQVRERAPDPEPIVLFRVESHDLVFHLGRPVHTLVEWADLNARLREPGPQYVVTRAEFVDEVRHTVAVPCRVVARNDGPVRPHRPLVLLRFGVDPCPTPATD